MKIRDVKCDFCSAAPGDLCVTSGGNTQSRSHRVRREFFMALYGKPPPREIPSQRRATISVEPIGSYLCPKCNLTMARSSLPNSYWYCMTPHCKQYQIKYRPSRVILTRLDDQ